MIGPFGRAAALLPKSDGLLAVPVSPGRPPAHILSVFQPAPPQHCGRGAATPDLAPFTPEFGQQRFNLVDLRRDSHLSE